MITENKAQFTKDVANKKIVVVKSFDADVETVWDAWTNAELLDKWWAPKPWKAETKSMNFSEGGTWLYSMVGPGGERHWCLADYKKINAPKNFTYADSFCDENGNKNKEAPSMNWNVVFAKAGEGTKVTIEITFASEADLNKILEMGFEAGFTMGLGNLDELLTA